METMMQETAERPAVEKVFEVDGGGVELPDPTLDVVTWAGQVLRAYAPAVGALQTFAPPTSRRVALDRCGIYRPDGTLSDVGHWILAGACDVLRRSLEEFGSERARLLKESEREAARGFREATRTAGGALELAHRWMLDEVEGGTRQHPHRPTLEILGRILQEQLAAMVEAYEALAA